MAPERDSIVTTFTAVSYTHLDVYKRQLRKAVQGLLKRNKYVKSYRLGEFGEGDAGVTIATFKQE